MTEDEIVGWHYQLNGHEFEQILGECEGQGRLACCNPWGHKELNTTKQLNNNNRKAIKMILVHFYVHSAKMHYQFQRISFLYTHKSIIQRWPIYKILDYFDMH